MKKRNWFFFGLCFAVLAAVFMACPTDGTNTEGGSNNGGDSGGEWEAPADTTTAYAEVFADSAKGTKVYFVAPDGDNTTGDGSKEKPWKTLGKVQEIVAPGDTVYLRGGRYIVDDSYDTDISSNMNGSGATRIIFNKSGEKGKVITYAGYPPDLAANSRPIFDFSQYKPLIDGSTQRRTIGMAIGTNAVEEKADWIWLRDFDLTGTVDYTLASGANGYVIQFNNGSHVTIEALRVYDCSGTGMFMFQNRANAFNLIKNCDFFNLHSEENPAMDQNTDGAGFHLESATSVGNVFYGNRGWAVGDDGFDNIRTAARTMYDNNWMAFSGFNYRWKTGQETNLDTWYSKFVNDGEDWINSTDSTGFQLLEYEGGNGNGLKMGGYGMSNGTERAWNNNPGNRGHVMRYNLTIGNRRAGVTHNYAGWASTDTQGQHYYNVTSYNNRINFEMISRDPDSISVNTAGKRRNAENVTMKNNISYKTINKEGNALNAIVSYAKDADGTLLPPQEFPVRWLDIDSPLNTSSFANNSFDLVDKGGKLNHAEDDLFNAAGAAGDAPDFDERGGLYPHGSQVVMDVIQDKFVKEDGTGGIQDDWFYSVDINLFLAPRKNNGDLPETALLRPRPGTAIADMGYTAADNDADGFATFWEYSGCNPLREPNTFPEKFK